MPAAHRSQVRLPALLVKVPASQGAQKEAFGEPSNGLAEPAGHCAHAIENGVVGAPKPASQGSQVARLRSASLSRWPFDPPTWPLRAE